MTFYTTLPPPFKPGPHFSLHLIKWYLCCLCSLRNPSDRSDNFLGVTCPSSAPLPGRSFSCYSTLPRYRLLRHSLTCTCKGRWTFNTKHPHACSVPHCPLPEDVKPWTASSWHGTTAGTPNIQNLLNTPISLVHISIPLTAENQGC